MINYYMELGAFFAYWYGVVCVIATLAHPLIEGVPYGQR